MNICVVLLFIMLMLCGDGEDAKDKVSDFGVIRKRDAGECTSLNHQPGEIAHFHSSWVIPSMKSGCT